MATRTNPRRQTHRKQNSLTAYDETYDQRNIHYAASPTPGFSASKHHRRNSLKAKQFNIASMYTQQNMNIKFSHKDRMKETETSSTNNKTYDINITIPKPIQTQCIDKSKSLKEWELQLTIKENELNTMKSKNTIFMQSLQKQISSLQKQLNKEQNVNKKHKLTAEELKELDIIKRENSTLRATIHRMKDEMKYIGNKNNIMYKNGNIHNNYYINAINYNNIINNHSNVNVETQSKISWKNINNDKIFNTESLSLHEMEKECIKRRRKVDERESILHNLWKIYRQERETLDSDRNSLEIGQRELFQNNRRLKMKLHQFAMLKHDELWHKLPQLLQKDAKTNEFGAGGIEIGRFNKIKLNSIKKCVENERTKRKENIKSLKLKFTKFKDEMFAMEQKLQENVDSENEKHRKYSLKIYEIIDGYISNKKKENGFLRRFDTKHFDPINLRQNLFGRKSGEIQVDDDEEEVMPLNNRGSKHRTQFSFERNMSFDISDLENNVEKEKEEKEVETGTGTAGGVKVESDSNQEEEEEETLPVFNRKRTMSMKMEHDEYKANADALSPNPPRVADHDAHGHTRVRIKEEVARDIKEYKFSEFDLLRIIKLIEEENDALRLNLSEIRCNNFSLSSCYFGLKYDKQLLLDQIQELNESNAELKYNIAEITETRRDDGILRQELLNKDTEIAEKQEELNAIYSKLSQMKKDYDSICDLYSKLKNRNETKRETKIETKMENRNENRESELVTETEKDIFINGLRTQVTALKESLIWCCREREDIYSLFSKYKKMVFSLKCELGTLKEIETEHRQITQQLSETQNELETEQRNYRRFKLKTRRKLSAMTEIEKQHRKLSSASIAKQRLDSLLGQSQDILREFEEMNVNFAGDDDMDDMDDDNGDLYYGESTAYDADTMMIVREADEYNIAQEVMSQHNRHSSMVINDNIVQDSQIPESHLSKDIDLEVTTVYGFDVDGLSPLRDLISDDKSVPHFQDPMHMAHDMNSAPNHNHYPQDSFIAMSSTLKQQILDKKQSNFQIMYDFYPDPQQQQQQQRRNTVDRYIEDKNEKENNKKVTIISERETQLLSPGKSPLSVIDKSDGDGDDNDLKSKFDATYRSILEINANKYNNNDETHDTIDDDDSTNSSPSKASDGYLELSDTMKISREEFVELRAKHNEKEMHNQLSEIHESDAHATATDTETGIEQIHTKNQSVDVDAKKHKRNETTLVDIPKFDETRVRQSHNINKEREKKQNQPYFGPNQHKTTNSIVSEHGTHYISYDNNTQHTCTQVKHNKAQTIDDIIAKNDIDLSLISAMQ